MSICECICVTDDVSIGNAVDDCQRDVIFVIKRLKVYVTIPVSDAIGFSDAIIDGISVVVSKYLRVYLAVTVVVTNTVDDVN